MPTDPSRRGLISGAAATAAFTALVQSPLGANPARAQIRPAPPVNPGLAISGPPVVGFASGEPGGTFEIIAHQISTVVSDQSLRVLVTLSYGSADNIGLLMGVRYTDMGFATTDAVQYVQRQGRFPDLERHIVYITPLYNNNVHILAGPGIKDVHDLAGKVVQMDKPGSGTAITAETVFHTLGITVKPAHDEPATAMNSLRSGEAAALVYVIGKPGPLFSQIPAGAGLHLVPLPPTPELLQTYLPSNFSHDDYPTLIPEGAEVEGLAVPVLLLAYNWAAGGRDAQRYANLAHFTDMFFTHVAAHDFWKAPNHPKWREVNIAATAPGLTRAPYAQAWLDAHSGNATPVAATGSPADQVAFNNWLTAQHLPAQLTGDQRQTFFELWLRGGKPMAGAR